MQKILFLLAFFPLFCFGQLNDSIILLELEIELDKKFWTYDVTRLMIGLFEDDSLVCEKEVMPDTSTKFSEKIDGTRWITKGHEYRIELYDISSRKRVFLNKDKFSTHEIKRHTRFVRILSYLHSCPSIRIPDLKFHSESSAIDSMSLKSLNHHVYILHEYTNIVYLVLVQHHTKDIRAYHKKRAELILNFFEKQGIASDRFKVKYIKKEMNDQVFEEKIDFEIKSFDYGITK